MSPRLTQGIVVLDTSCYRYLAEPSALRRFTSNLRAAALTAAASEVNLIEAAGAGHADVQRQLIATIREVANGNPLLPWPFLLLRRSGRAILDGQSTFQTTESGNEWYLDDLEACRALRTRCLEFNDRLESAFTEFHERARVEIQEYIKRSGERRRRDGARDFLDNEWRGSPLYLSVMSTTWKAIGLPGEPHIASVSSNEQWSIFLDAEGLSIYQRGIAHEQPRRVQRKDVIQLPYLGAEGRRILATADEPFQGFARIVIEGRYLGARIVHIQELLT